MKRPKDGSSSRVGILVELLENDYQPTFLKANKEMEFKAGDLLRISSGPQNRRIEWIHVMEITPIGIRVQRGWGRYAAKKFHPGARIVILANLRQQCEGVP